MCVISNKISNLNKCLSRGKVLFEAKQMINLTFKIKALLVFTLTLTPSAG